MSRNSKGITLIALVITIIVLLILAGMSLSLVMGNEGILGKATTAVDKNNKETAIEELELAVSDMNIKYYQQYDENSGKKIGTFIRENLNGYETADGTISCEEEKVIYVCGHDTVTGMIDDEGSLEIDKEGIFINPKKVTLKIETETMPTENITANLIEIEGNITWTSSDPSVATVAGTGKNATITAVAKGTTTIAASCGNYSDTCIVTVKAVDMGLRVGSEVTYTPSGTYEWKAEYAMSYNTTNQTLNSGEGGSFQITKWRVLEMDEERETVKMVSATSMTETVSFQGAQGYNNAVKMLNDACSSLYSSEGVTAKSIDIEDIEELYTPEALEERGNYTNTQDSAESIKYGERYTKSNSYKNSEGEYTMYRNYSVMYERESDSIIKAVPEIAEGKEKNLGLSKQTQLIERNEGGTMGKKTASISIHPKQTYYDLGTSYNDFKTKFKNYAEGKTYENIVLPNGADTNYWVASRCVDQTTDICGFFVRDVSSGYLSANWMYGSDNSMYSHAMALFPVVSLSSELISEDGAGNFVVE